MHVIIKKGKAVRTLMQKKIKVLFSLQKENDENKVNSKREGISETESQRVEENEEDIYKFDGIDYETENLNKLTTKELNIHKAIMEKDYTKNAILPGSEDFVYDVQKEFECDEYDNEWDEEI